MKDWHNMSYPYLIHWARQCAEFKPKAKINMTATIKTGSFTKYQLADQMRNYMHIDDKYLEGLAVYQMIHFSGKSLKLSLNDGQVYCHKSNMFHSVIYHNCTPYHAKRAVEVRLSFRCAQPEYNLEPIVLVEIVIPFQPIV